jgi:hypothetical protein
MSLAWLLAKALGVPLMALGVELADAIPPFI